jgi:tetratricopeptide (TPR) repeat protein
MAEPEKIVYSPEEQQEIDRILGVVSESLFPGEAVVIPPPVQDEPVPAADDMQMDSLSDDGLPVADDKGFEESGFTSDESSAQYTEDSRADISDVKQEGLEEIDDIVDLSSEMQPVEEPAPVENISDSITEITDENFDSISDDRLSEDRPFEEDDISPAIPEKAVPPAIDGGGSPMQQLETITYDEPESLDPSEVTDTGEFLGDASPVDMQPEIKPEVKSEEIPEMGDFSDVKLEDFSDAGAAITDSDKPQVSLGIDSDSDIPDLSDISLEEASPMQEADTSDIPDINIDDFGGVSADSLTEAPPKVQDEFDLESVDSGIEAMSDLTGDDFSSRPKTSVSSDIGEDLSEDFIEPPKKEVKQKEPKKKEKVMPDPDSFSVEPLDDDMHSDFGAAGPKSKAKSDEPVDLSEKELRKLRTAIVLFNPGVIKVIKETVINDLLPPADTRQLVDMIISGKSEDTVRKFLEKKLKRKVDLTESVTPSGRRVISSRPEYTREGIERRKKLLQKTRIFGIAAGVTFILSIIGYQFIYKPYMAKKKINEGVELITRAGDYEQKPLDYKKAEEIFKYVHENYAENYIFGYNAYGMAYFKKKEVNRSIEKLNEAYRLNPKLVDTLNNLGYFYARVPADDFRSMQNKMNDWYYGAKKPEANKRAQVDIAIDFYKRSLVVDHNNTTAMYGIGNAYFSQGQYLKAKKYYEDIIRVDKKSVIGHSGLLNLYIERDAFAQVAGVHFDLRDKKIIEEVPSPLLGKLAMYYLSKRRSEKVNVRIDYAVQSPRLIDENDDTYPAVMNVLQALNKKDSKYPPLQVYYALLNKSQNKPAVMKRYLDKAVQTQNYFGAYYLMGEYYYQTKEPVNAFKYLNMAIKAYASQPDFTQEEFYKETESLGKAYAVTGNLFYYFFDKVRLRLGDLEDELIDEEITKAENYSIARDKYELAVTEGYTSSELYYNLGRIYYLNRLYSKALDNWLNLYDDFVRNPELMFALGNAFYHERKYESSRGEYLKLISVFEYDAEKILTIDLSRKDHVKLFSTLASAHNNLGAIYQLKNDEAKSNINYWKAIDYAKRIDKEHELARVNMARAFKSDRDVDPILDENVPYSIDIYRADMR